MPASLSYHQKGPQSQGQGPASVLFLQDPPWTERLVFNHMHGLHSSGKAGVPMALTLQNTERELKRSRAEAGEA